MAVNVIRAFAPRLLGTFESNSTGMLIVTVRHPAGLRSGEIVGSAANRRFWSSVRRGAASTARSGGTTSIGTVSRGSAVPSIVSTTIGPASAWGIMSEEVVSRPGSDWGQWR